MSSNVKRLTMFAIIISGIVVSGVSIFLKNYYLCTITLVSGIIITVAGVIYGICFVRCPNCKKQLPLQGIWIDYCPKCGEKLD